MKHLTTIFFVFFTHFLLAQEVSIKTLDIEKKSLSNINVQILKNNKTIDFKTTNENGICSFSISNKGNYTLKFTSLSIKTKLVEINTLEKSDYEITLEKQITEIQEVKIKARPKIAFAKQDTISYNVKAIKDGTERTVEDLVRKLPGLDIVENGKITHNGNILGQVLVDGNEFFGKNHKMATQNITAEMIDGIDLWQKYTTMSGNQSTALNLKLKEEYKGKITGNTDGNYGSKNQYLTHSNIFKFNKSGNLALITDFNSIAKDPISTMDFIEMTRQDDTDNANESRMAIPSFLNNDGKVEKKNNQFGALQYAKSNKKFSITAFSMINAIQTDKFSTLNRTAFDGQPTTYNFNENRSEANKGIFGATQIKMKKIFGDHSFLYYNFGYNPSEDQFNQNLSRISNATQTLYDTDNRIRNNSYNHFLSWTKKYTISKIIVSFAQQTNSNNTDLIIDSNKPLFLNSLSKLQQNLDTKNERYDVNIQLKNNFDFATVNFKTGYSYKK
ncbi:MAG: hypothetical protein JSS94_09010 [Bacteroidetes bacterium]|nr:hypothetical protein [Bacteroidota bacterium]